MGLAPATFLQATGFVLPGFPSMGAWISYGLGSMNEDLPTFVVLPDHRGLASNGSRNWDSTFLPARHQGTVIFPGQASPISDLFPARNNVVRMGVPPIRIEILTSISGVEFESCYAEKEMIQIEDIVVPAISLARLRENKAASGRGKDLADLESLPHQARRFLVTASTLIELMRR